MDKKLVNRAADNIRLLSAAMVEKAKSGHPGGAMGGADFVNILYTEFLNYDPTDMAWPHRDRFFLDPGHMSPMLYSVLALSGLYKINELKQFRQWGSPAPGHPEKDVMRGVENTSGPLGLGHASAVGAAIAERFLVARFGEWMTHKTYTFISDGGIQEGVSQCAGRIAGHLGLHNLIMFYDSNDIQLSTGTDSVSSEDTAKKYEAWGWRVKTIDGNNPDEIRKALQEANNEKEKPFLIVGKTIMGKGCLTDKSQSFEKEISTHGQPIGKAGASFRKTVENLGGNPENPFEIFGDVKEYYQKIRQDKIEAAKIRKEEQRKWETDNPELAQKLTKFLAMEMPDIDYQNIEQQENIPSRNASGNVLKHFASRVENLIVASADLANSDKTDGFLKGGAKPIKKGDFSGAFFHAGVSELGLAAIANGIALHGGVFVACGTFFVFSDFMKPAVRLSALMELPVKYIWSHDAFRVGEDGPTHQPIEQEAQIRLLEKVKNHSGENSMLVLRPADVAETTITWKMAMENTKTPTGMIFSRQAIKDLPPKPNSNRFDDAMQSYKGGYIVQKSNEKPDVVMIANGSEVSTLIEGAELLRKEKNINTQIVSVISEGLFRNQPAEYQKQVIPDNVPVFGLTAGLSHTLIGLAGTEGKIFGLDHFGYSAPAGVLDEKFGFTAENVYKQVCELLNC